MSDTDFSLIASSSEDFSDEVLVETQVTDNDMHDSASQTTGILQNPEANTLPKTTPSRPKLLKSNPQVIRMNMKSWDEERRYHRSMCPLNANSANTINTTHLEEIRTAPLFSANVLKHIREQKRDPSLAKTLLPAYGFLARKIETFDGKADLDHTRTTPYLSEGGVPLPQENLESAPEEPEDDRLMLNMNTPWSAFICGSQGSGKSHTLSCMLENALVASNMGKLPRKLAGIVFHYDKFTAVSSTQVCEAAFIASKIPVKVLVSPSNYFKMQNAYENLPGFSKSTKQLEVVPLLLHERHLNVARMMTLMAVDEKDGKGPLYLESLRKILRQMAMANRGAQGFNFSDFERRLQLEILNEGQRTMLETRLQLLKSFLCLPQDLQQQKVVSNVKPYFPDTKKGWDAERKWLEDSNTRTRSQLGKANSWSFEPGTLTIVDLSCPFVDESAACSMFDICLALFLEGRSQAGRIVALDEAHKFMTATESSHQFTASLLSVIRQQRHLATRVIIATQEPTISPALLDLASMTIVHRFTSRNWMSALRSHLAGIPDDGENIRRNTEEIFQRIVDLDAGQALLFSPSAMLLPEDAGYKESLRMQKLGIRYFKMQVRKRVTADGGRSILAV